MSTLINSLSLLKLPAVFPIKEKMGDAAPNLLAFVEQGKNTTLLIQVALDVGVKPKAVQSLKATWEFFTIPPK